MEEYYHACETRVRSSHARRGVFPLWHYLFPHPTDPATDHPDLSNPAAVLANMTQQHTL
jgi:hypothetical protein